MAKTFNKNCSITEKETELLAEIKSMAISERVILSDSSIVRLGIHLVHNLSKEKLIKLSKEYILKTY